MYITFLLYISFVLFFFAQVIYISFIYLFCFFCISYINITSFRKILFCITFFVQIGLRQSFAGNIDYIIFPIKVICINLAYKHDFHIFSYISLLYKYLASL